LCARDKRTNKLCTTIPRRVRSPDGVFERSNDYTSRIIRHDIRTRADRRMTGRGKYVVDKLKRSVTRARFRIHDTNFKFRTRRTADACFRDISIATLDRGSTDTFSEAATRRRYLFT
jgi:hypothetical protein